MFDFGDFVFCVRLRVVNAPTGRVELAVQRTLSPPLSRITTALRRSRAPVRCRILLKWNAGPYMAALMKIRAKPAAGAEVSRLPSAVQQAQQRGGAADTRAPGWFLSYFVPLTRSPRRAVLAAIRLRCRNPSDGK